MGLFGGMLDRIAPGFALRRETAAVQLDLLRANRAAMMSAYEPVGGGRRGAEFRRNHQDATEAARHARAPLAAIARDMLRNNPRVVRANKLISGYTVGAGIVPVVSFRAGVGKRVQDQVNGLIRDHLMSTAIDADGLHSLFGLQKLAMRAIPISGEVLVRRRVRRASDGLPLPFQMQVLEPEFIVADRTMSYRPGAPAARGAGAGPEIDAGIEYGPTGRIQAMWLYDRHPGSQYGAATARRVAAENLCLAYLADRPGQRRGVSWYAPVMTELHDLHKLMQATLKKQEVAAMFAGVLRTANGGATDSMDLPTITAGSITEIGMEESLEFNSPPSSVGAEAVMMLLDRVIAAALGLTYEGFTGDYSRVNYSSGRMGRMDQDPIVSDWQQSLMVSGMLAKLGGWTKEAIALQAFVDPADYTINWTPPVRPVVDPTKDWPALGRKVELGFTSRREIIRQSGADPAVIEAEIAAERGWEDASGVRFSTRTKAEQADAGADAGATTEQGNGTDE